jgi:hypothetical protein
VSDANDGAAFLTWLVMAHLPEQDMYMDPHPDDPDYDPSEVPNNPIPDAAALQQHLQQAAGVGDSEPMPGPLPPGGQPPLHTAPRV